MPIAQDTLSGRVCNIVADYHIEESELPIVEVSLNTNLQDDLGMDSLDLLELAFDIERGFEEEGNQFRIPDDEFPEWETVKDIIHSVEKRMIKLSTP